MSQNYAIKIMPMVSYTTSSAGIFSLSNFNLKQKGKKGGGRKDD